MLFTCEQQVSFKIFGGIDGICAAVSQEGGEPKDDEVKEPVLFQVICHLHGRFSSLCCRI